MMRWKNLAALAAAMLVAVAFCGRVSAGSEGGLRSVTAFEEIKDQSERSRALFMEVGKVLTHARCLNCHPSGDSPSQGEDRRSHRPTVTRGPAGMGVTGMRCQTCHGAENYDPAGVPGDPHWSLAPAEMAWQGLTLAQLCRQIKDPARNGGRSVAGLVQHMQKDSLVGWAWSPGAGREPAPGSWEQFGQLVQAWADTGAACPEEQ